MCGGNGQTAEAQYTAIGKEGCLRQEISDEITSMRGSSGDTTVPPDALVQSGVYREVQRMIAEKRVIKDGDDIWDELERTITDVSPEFVKNLNAVTKGKLTEAEMRTAFLIKLGFSPTQIASLSGKIPGGDSIQTGVDLHQNFWRQDGG